MRYVYLGIWLLVLGAIGVFAFQNREMVTLSFLNWGISCPVSLLVILVYLLGMASGWTMLSVMRMTLSRATSHPKD